MPKRSRDDDEEPADAGDAPTDINPYFVLDLELEATQDEIKKAYRKAALRHHPDKAAPEDKQAAHEKFQEVAFAFAILSDERRRARFDNTGSTAESLDLEDDDFDWGTFFRQQFKDVVTSQRIDEFGQQYRGSEEERQAVLQYYSKHHGDMIKVYEEVMMSDMAEDEERFRGIINAATKNGEVEEYDKYTKESRASIKKRVDKAKKRKEEFDEEAALEKAEELKGGKKKKGRKGIGADNTGDLAALIQQRQQGRAENFFDKLEEKYAPKQKARKGEPPEEAFAANRKKAKNVKR